MLRREIDIAVLSDLHLGSFSCHAHELLQYLQSIRPKILVLNGDIVDVRNNYSMGFTAEHRTVLHQIMLLADKGSTVYYIVGNRDDQLRKYVGSTFGDIEIRDKLVLHLKGKKYCFFHGDVFDASLSISPLLATLGSKGYRVLVRLNRIIDHCRRALGKERMSFAKKIKTKVGRAQKFIAHFEHQVSRLAASQNYQYVVCGHIHRPIIKQLNGVTYMNSGDWVENLTALEYNFGKWHLYQYDELDYNFHSPRLAVPPPHRNTPPKNALELEQFIFPKQVVVSK